MKHRHLFPILGAIALISILMMGLSLTGSTPASAAMAPRATPVTIDVDLPSTSTNTPPTGTLAVRIYAPATPADARYPEGASTPDAAQAQPPILVSIVTHNEEPPQYPDFVNNQSAFWQHRNALVQFADMLYANGVMFNYQSDWNFLQAVAKYDTGTPETNGKNVVRYIKEDLGFEVDPHAHETLFNYADVAYLIEALGVTPSHTVGGMIVHAPEISILEQFWQPITGRQYPTYTWQAEVTWGGGTKLHENEELLWASGVWKPKDKYHFLEHDDAAPLPNVGKYGGRWENLDRLLQLQQNGELEDKIHTCTISVRQDSLLIAGFIQQLEQRIQARDATGDIRWVGLAEVIDIWQTEYDSEPNILRYLTPRAYLPLIFKNYTRPPVTPTPTPSAAYEPPINVTFNIHLDPVLDDYQKWRERKDNLLWLESFVEGYSGEYQPKLNVEVQGDHAEFYLNPADPEAAEGREALADLYAAGHSFGTHAHNSVRGEAPHSWAYIQGIATAAQAVENWQDHIGYVEQLYAAITGVSDPEFLQQMNASAAMFLPIGGTETRLAFTGVYSDPVSGETVPHGFSAQTGGMNEHFYCLYDHDVQNPWRPGAHGALDEDLTNTAFVTIPQMPPLGNIGVHAHIPDCRQDNSVPSRQRMFIQEFLERLYREHTDAPDKVWTFGWHEHLFDIYPAGSSGPGKRDLREDMELMVDWLNERFIGQTTASGNLVAQYATVTGVRDEFEAWEESNPGVSSFELSQYTADWDNYPYELKGLAQELANAHYDAALLPPDSTLQIYRFERCPSSLRDETQGQWAEETDGTFSCYDALTGSTPLTTTTVYVAWRDADTSELTDLTAYVGDWATAYDGISGDFLAADDALNAYPLDFRPVVILPSAAEPAPAGYLVISYNANYLRGSPGNVQQATAQQFVPTLNRHLDLIDGLDMAADYYFTGLAAEKLAEWSTQTVTRLLDSRYGLHYHGANRPPYPQLVDQVLGEDWEQDVATVRTYETDGLNPATGAHVGGITAFRNVFGQDPFATGRFFEASILAVNKEMGVKMAVGLEDNTGASRNDAWFLGVLNRSESLALGPSQLVDAALHDQGEEYLAQVRAQLTSLTDPMPIVAVLAHDHDFYKHPPADQEKIWALYEQVLELTQELGFRSVTLHDIYALAENGPAPTLTQHELLQAAQSLVQTIEASGYLPEYLTANGTPYSLAESFEALAHTLTAYRQTGSLPASVDTHDLLGPTVIFHSSVTTATLLADDVLGAAVAVSAAITDRLPSQISVGSQTVAPAEFLYLMAQEYAAIAQGATAPVTLSSISALPLATTQNFRADPLTKLQFWTYKPAVFAVGQLDGVTLISLRAPQGRSNLPWTGKKGGCNPRKELGS